MKAAKILLPLALIAAAPTAANAARSGPTTTSTSCYFQFAVSWFGYMYVPCQAVSNSR